MINNSLMFLNPYKFKGQWVFDDPSTGLVKEPFVCGIDTIIDKVVENLTDPQDGFLLIFSASEFPGSNIELNWLHSESGGNWYRCSQLKIDGWLCPALFKYFTTAPINLFATVKNIK